MRQLLLLLLFTCALTANDFIEDFYAEQIALEVRIEDENLSDNALEAALEKEQAEYRHFFVAYLTKERSGHNLDPNPYRAEIFKLKQRVRINQQRDNSYAVIRDELRITTLTLKQNMRQTMHEVAQAARLDSEKAFDKALQQIVVKRHDNDAQIDLSRYATIAGIDHPDAITKSVQANLTELGHVLVIHNNLSAALIDNADRLYKVSALSGYGLIPLSLKISETAVGKLLDPYLSYVYLSSAKVVLIVLILAAFYLVRKGLINIIGRLLRVAGFDAGDIAYVFDKIARSFTLFLLLLGSQMILAVYSGLADVPWLMTLYDISYIFIVAFFVYRFGNAIAVIKLEQLERNEFIRNEVINLGLKVMNGIIGLVALIFILKMLGVDLTAILSGLGIGGVAVAFAAKDTIANFFGSVSILLGDLFEQGDWIAVGDIEGTVVELGLRATTIRTFDNALIAIPNFKLADNEIKNWSRRTIGRRIRMKIGVTYESDMDNVKKAIETIRQMLQEHPGVATEKTAYLSSERKLRLVSKEDLKGIKNMITVHLDEFSSSSIDILVYCFSHSVIWHDWLAVKEDIMFKIADILKENDLSFAYPTMMLHQAQEE